MICVLVYFTQVGDVPPGVEKSTVVTKYCRPPAVERDNVCRSPLYTRST